MTQSNSLSVALNCSVLPFNSVTSSPHVIFRSQCMMGHLEIWPRAGSIKVYLLKFNLLNSLCISAISEYVIGEKENLCLKKHINFASQIYRHNGWQWAKSHQNIRLLSQRSKHARTALETLAYSLRAFSRRQGPNNQRRKCQQPTTKITSHWRCFTAQNQNPVHAVKDGCYAPINVNPVGRECGQCVGIWSRSKNLANFPRVGRDTFIKCS